MPGPNANPNFVFDAESQLYTAGCFSVFKHGRRLYECDRAVIVGVAFSTAMHSSESILLYVFYARRALARSSHSRMIAPRLEQP
jgi:hypothetical protein